MQLKKLQTKFLGQEHIYYEEIDSTQNEIWRRIEKNIKNGTLVMCGKQTQGKGTHGRKWYTESPNNIAFSFYIDINCNVKKIEGITIKIAEILVDIIEKLYNIKINIKAPNDLILSNKKVGGILTESKIVGETVKFLVIGIGINTIQTEFNKNLEGIATSIKNECKIEVNAEDIISEFCNNFEEYILKI